MEIYQVDPKSIRIVGSPAIRDIRHQAARLETEGQIEPIVITCQGRVQTRLVDTDHDEHFHLDEAIVQAACWLGWPTILVTC